MDWTNRYFRAFQRSASLLRNYATQENNLFAINLIKDNKRVGGCPLLLINLKMGTCYN